MNIEVLRQYGLNDKEARLYLANLALGTASITQLSKKANLKRPTTYLVIDRLIRENLLVAVPQGKNFYYKAQHPDQLTEQLDQKRLLIRELLPELQSLYNKTSNEPHISFFEGKDKLKFVYEQVFQAKQIWALFSVNKFLQIFSERDNRHFFRILIRHGGVINDLVEDSRKTREFMQAKYRSGVSNTKFLPQGATIDTDILIYNNKVALVSFDNLTVSVIDDVAIANTLRTALQLIWQSLS